MGMMFNVRTTCWKTNICKITFAKAGDSLCLLKAQCASKLLTSASSPAVGVGVPVYPEHSSPTMSPWPAPKWGGEATSHIAGWKAVGRSHTTVYKTNICKITFAQSGDSPCLLKARCTSKRLAYASSPAVGVGTPVHAKRFSPTVSTCPASRCGEVTSSVACWKADGKRHSHGHRQAPGVSVTPEWPRRSSACRG